MGNTKATLEASKLSDKTPNPELDPNRRLAQVGRLAAGIGHDLNNILISVIGNIELAKSAMRVTSDEYRAVNDAGLASLKAARLVKQLMNAARPRCEEKGSFLLSNAAQTAIALTKASLQSGVQVKLQIASPEPRLLGMFDDIVDLFINLIQNADDALQGKHDQEDPQITITIQTCHHQKCPTCTRDPTERELEVIITDNGVGMCLETLSRISKPFFTTKDKGNGLGLSNVWHTVKTHAGCIEPSSTLGQGTTFRIRLPLPLSDAL
ncbi:sensor histidine kinase [Patescibacteria group bacterium]